MQKYLTSFQQFLYGLWHGFCEVFTWLASRFYSYMENSKSKNNKRKVSRRRGKSNIGMVLFIFFVLVVVAVVVTINRTAGDNKEEQVMIEAPIIRSTNLPQLAKQYYGNTVFWVYIYIKNQNKLSSPVNIPEGIELIIPDLLVDYNIDTNDSLEIAKAVLLANNILERKAKE
ncbi:MAG: hypothetical protein LBV57_05490 [Candidatus Symbiothrix sp.]|nr:hypothetical protein [Candidatus Symbiothrix sp.]